MDRQLRLELGEAANARVRVTLPAEVQQSLVALMRTQSERCSAPRRRPR